MTRGEKVIAFIERYCVVPQGGLRGRKMKLEEFQRRFILEVYDNPQGTSRAYLSIARKNGKSAFIASIALAHIVGPEAVQNSQIITGARSKEQAGVIYKLASQMVNMNPELQKLVRLVPSRKQIVGLARNVEFESISAEGTTAHGLSPILAILDEVGQVRGEYDAFIEAVETSQGAYEQPLLIAISTQAPTDADLFSRWLDDAATSEDPHIVSHLYAAAEDADVLDERAWKDANPALGRFRSYDGLKREAEIAARVPSKERSFRWLNLNQRISAVSPFLSPNVWRACEGKVPEDWGDAEVFAGLDLSQTTDLTALVLVGRIDGKLYVRPTFWLPEDGLREKANAAKLPYERYVESGTLNTTPGPAIEYDYVARHLRKVFDRYNVQKVAFDRHFMKFLTPCLRRAGFDEAEIEERFENFGQGYASMAPAVTQLETLVLKRDLVHDGNELLTNCAMNSVIKEDEAGNRKLDKKKSPAKIDGMVALAMAVSVAGTDALDSGPSVYEERGVLVL